MSLNTYFRVLLGESKERIARLHPSTINRLKAYAIALHIPVALWAVSGYIVAHRVFGQTPASAAGVALFCMALVYLIERLVLATPKGILVSLLRSGLACLIAVMGASTIDLVLFEREIADTLKTNAMQEQSASYDHQLVILSEREASIYKEWQLAINKANCEANGTCGSRQRSVGPIYRELASQADVLWMEFGDAKAKREAKELERDVALKALANSDAPLNAAGLLARIEALHRYVRANPYAMAAWLIVFSIILALELMVVFVKWSFEETVDDRLERTKEDLSEHRAREYFFAATSPLRMAQILINEQ